MARKADELDDLDLEDFDAEEDEEVKATKKGKASKKSDKPKGIGARQLAEHLEAEPKTFRAWLRRKVEAGELPELGDRETKTRYDFGASLTSPVAKKIITMWGADSHERGAGLEKAQAAKKAKAGTAAKKPAAKKKAAS